MPSGTTHACLTLPGVCACPCPPHPHDCGAHPLPLRSPQTANEHVGGAPPLFKLLSSSTQSPDPNPTPTPPHSPPPPLHACRGMESLHPPTHPGGTTDAAAAPSLLTPAAATPTPFSCPSAPSHPPTHPGAPTDPSHQVRPLKGQGVGGGRGGGVGWSGWGRADWRRGTRFSTPAPLPKRHVTVLGPPPTLFLSPFSHRPTAPSTLP